MKCPEKHVKDTCIFFTWWHMYFLNSRFSYVRLFWNPISVPNYAELNSFLFSNGMSQPKQWSAYAKFNKSENQGFGTILKTNNDELLMNFTRSVTTFQLQRNFPTFGQFFPTSLGCFKLQSALSNFAWLFPTSAKLSNFSFFPTTRIPYLLVKR